MAETTFPKGLSILAIDDEVINLAVINQVLKEHLTIYSSTSGERAIKLLEEVCPDLILLDLEMPGMNGYEVIDALKSNLATSHIPVIILTGHTSNDMQVKAYAHGACDFISKPINDTTLIERAKLHLEIQQYKKQINEGSAANVDFSEQSPEDANTRINLDL